MPWKMNRTWRVVLIVLVLLVAFRLSLPYFVTRYVNKVLNELEGYRGSVHDVDIHLYRGAYQIDSLKVFKIQGNKEIPFINIPLTDLSIEWQALMKGSLVGEITFEKPVINFIGEKKEAEKKDNDEQPAEEQTGKEVDWTEPIRKLMPFDINRLTVNDGTIAFYDLSTEPKVDLFLHNLQLEALNLNNASDNPEDLPSRVYLQALSIGNGQLNLAMKINVLKEIPDLDMDVRFENVDMKALNDFFQAYARVDVQDGIFNLYSEVAVSEGIITGYVKPLFNGLKVADAKEDQEQPAQLVWESVVDFLAEVFENQKKDQFATRVPLEGHISEVNTTFWPVLWNVFSNAFVEAFENNTDGTITLASANVSKKEPVEIAEKKSKKELRKEKRREKKEQRRRERKQKRAKEENEKADKKNVKDNS
jgi:hypothetical protein